ncbi:MAG: GGDEF domain-containing protein [Burkholderiales bacterium]|nr:GGDEF domain-containing protein [Burkholderiales bacterium]
MTSIADELAKNELLRDVPESVLRLVMEHAVPLEVAPGEVLLSPERENHHVYLLLSGTLSLRFDSLDSPEIRELSAGISVGEMSLIDDAPPSAYVVAKEAGRVLRLHRDIILGLVTANPVAYNLLRLLTKWMKANTEHIIQDRLRISELTDHAHIDGLTGLYNRRWLDNTLARLLQQARKDGLPLTILLADIDGFKEYNDAHGHQGGDRALIAVSEVLKAAARPYDFPTRYGGEEFLILLQNTTIEGGIALAERIRHAVEVKSVVTAEGAPLPGITLSIGVATNLSHVMPASLISAADAQLYRAKRAGKNRVCY